MEKESFKISKKPFNGIAKQLSKVTQMLSFLLVSTIIVQLKMGYKIMSKQFIGTVKLQSKVMLELRDASEYAIVMARVYLKIMSRQFIGFVKLPNKEIYMLSFLSVDAIIREKEFLKSDRSHVVL